MALFSNKKNVPAGICKQLCYVSLDLREQLDFVLRLDSCPAA